MSHFLNNITMAFWSVLFLCYFRIWRKKNAMEEMTQKSYDLLYGPKYISRMKAQSSKHHNSQTVRARDLKFWHNVCHPLCVMCHLSRVTCHFFSFFFLPSTPQKNIGPMIRIGREIQCLPYAGFFFIILKTFFLVTVWTRDPFKLRSV